VIRIAAVGDVHLGEGEGGRLRPALEHIGQHADVLLLAGDLTRRGTLAAARVVAAEFAGLPVPVIAVLGNHDYHSDVPDQITALLGEHGIGTLEGEAVTVEVNGLRFGIGGRGLHSAAARSCRSWWWRAGCRLG
jgi:predicted MPP superfamily phosphohydrolase